jgi:hypothetical protein
MAHRKRPVLRCGVGHRRGGVDAAIFETFNGYIGKLLLAMVDRDEAARKTRSDSGGEARCLATWVGAGIEVNTLAQ